MDAEARAVLSFWFGDDGDQTDAAALRRKVDRWYRGGAKLDDEIRERFSDTVEAALRGERDGWAVEPLGRLALVIALDQFPRSIHRDVPRAYAGDAAAQRLAIDAFDRGLDRTLSLEQRMFLIMPLVHAEDRGLQERGVREMTRLNADAPPALQSIYAMGLEQSNKYLDIITRYGRFPHRNQILGRASTAEEQEFLEDWPQKAPPKEMRR